MYSPSVAYLVSHILADRESRSLTFGLDGPLATRYWTAAKTGTSRDMRDNWCVGYSRRYTVGVWVGNFPGEPMRDVSGISGAAPIWREVMDWLHRDGPSAARPTRTPPSAHPGARDEEPAAGERQAPWAESRGHFARIVAPTRQRIIAIDPDIPPHRQRVILEAAGTTGGLRWRINADELGPAGRIVTWSPKPGRYTLMLVDEAQRAVDAVSFEVRGPRSR